MSLRTKIAAAIVSLILTLGLAGTLHARITLENQLRRELVQRGTFAAANIASGSEEALITNDVFTVYELINAAVVNDEDIRYVFVVNSAGDVMAKTFLGALPAGLAAANGIGPDGTGSTVRLPTDEGPVQDIAYPILEGRVGTVRVGLSENRLLARVSDFTLQLLGLTAGVTALALVVSFLLAILLTRPLARLAAAARAVGGGDLSQQVATTSRDEVGRLAAAFNSMTVDLSRSRAEIDQFNREILRRSQDLAALNALATSTSQSLDLDLVMEAALENSLPLMAADAGGILLFDERTGHFVYGAHRGFPEDFVKSVAGVPFGEALEGQAAARGEAIVVDDLAADESARAGILRRFGLRSFASTPLRAGEQILGVMSVGRTGHAPFQSSDVQLLVAIGNQTGVAIQNAKLWQELQEKEQAHAELLKKIISVQEEERQRVARELHDETAQELTALLMGLGTLEGVAPPSVPSTVATTVQTVKQFASRALDDTRRLILDLRPPVLDDLGLVSAVREHAEAHLTPQGVSYDLSAQGMGERLPSAVEVALFRILQEAINNCARHSGARHAQIRLECVDSQVQASVDDDGKGFDVWNKLDRKQGKPPLGILGMRERAALLGGELAIDSAPDKGTRISVRVPLDGLK
ncbi:MAG: GAF domain-containing protein [Dehalococcoidia bacterium]